MLLPAPCRGALPDIAGCSHRVLVYQCGRLAGRCNGLACLTNRHEVRAFFCVGLLCKSHALALQSAVLPAAAPMRQQHLECQACLLC